MGNLRTFVFLQRIHHFPDTERGLKEIAQQLPGAHLHDWAQVGPGFQMALDKWGFSFRVSSESILIPISAQLLCCYCLSVSALDLSPLILESTRLVTVSSHSEQSLNVLTGSSVVRIGMKPLPLATPVTSLLMDTWLLFPPYNTLFTGALRILSHLNPSPCLRLCIRRN